VEDLIEAGGAGTVLVPFASSSSTRFFQRSLPISQSKLSVCTPRR
jgi:hypothetical protein